MIMRIIMLIITEDRPTNNSEPFTNEVLDIPIKYEPVVNGHEDTCVMYHLRKDLPITPLNYQRLGTYGSLPSKFNATRLKSGRNSGIFFKKMVTHFAKYFKDRSENGRTCQRVHRESHNDIIKQIIRIGEYSYE